MRSSAKSYSIKNLRVFAAVLSLGVVLIFGIIPYVRHLPNSSFNYWVFVFCFAISFVALAKPYMLRRPYLLWMRLGMYLAAFNSRLILGIFFFFIICPIAIIARFIRLMVASLSSPVPLSFRVAPSGQISTFSDQH